MTGRARKEWKRLAPTLIAEGLVTVGDLHAFEEYCRIVGEIDTYEAEVASLVKDGKRDEAHRLGYANHLVKLRRLIAPLRQQLGLTPSSRSSVKATKVTTPADTQRARFFGKPA